MPAQCPTPPTRTIPSACRLALGRPLAMLAVLIALVALTRLLPGHTPNVTAVAATALFAGWFFRSRWLALAAPLGAMLVSDSVLGGYHPAIMAVVYASLAAPVFFRGLMGDGASLRRLFGGAVVGSLAASILFFATTNLAVWAFAGYYTRDLAGLAECFAAALPFFRFTAGGDLAFTLALFGGYALIARAAGPATSRRAVLPA